MAIGDSKESEGNSIRFELVLSKFHDVRYAGRKPHANEEYCMRFQPHPPLRGEHLGHG